MYYKGLFCLLKGIIAHEMEVDYKIKSWSANLILILSQELKSVIFLKNSSHNLFVFFTMAHNGGLMSSGGFRRASLSATPKLVAALNAK